MNEMKIGVVYSQSIGIPIETTDGQLIRKDQLKVGLEVLVHGLQQDYVSVVEAIEDGWAKIKDLYAHVQFDDERNCWVNRFFAKDLDIKTVSLD